MLKNIREKGLDEVLVIYKLDVIIVFIGLVVWKIDLINGDFFLGGSLFLVVCVGYFNIIVFMGWIEGFLVGIFFFSGVWKEFLLIEMVYVYEQVLMYWKVLIFKESQEEIKWEIRSEYSGFFIFCFI